MRISDWSSDVCSSDLRIFTVILQSALEIDQHDDAEFGGDACQCDEPHSRRNRLMVSKQVEEPEAAGERERQRAHDERSLIEPTEGHEQQHEDDRQRGGYDDFQPLGCRSEEHTSELQSLMRISYAVFCLKKKNKTKPQH